MLFLDGAKEKTTTPTARTGVVFSCGRSPFVAVVAFGVSLAASLSVPSAGSVGAVVFPGGGPAGGFPAWSPQPIATSSLLPIEWAIRSKVLMVGLDFRGFSRRW